MNSWDMARRDPASKNSIDRDLWETDKSRKQNIWNGLGGNKKKVFLINATYNTNRFPQKLSEIVPNVYIYSVLSISDLNC